MNSLLSDWDKFRSFLDAWVVAGKSHSAACDDRAAAIGYCFGGCAMLEMVRGGIKGVQGAVSFHGVLTSFPQPMPDGTLAESKPHRPNSYTTAIKLLVENGADDHLVPDAAIRAFADEFNAAGVDWTFHNHAHTPHGFALGADTGPDGKKGCAQTHLVASTQPAAPCSLTAVGVSQLLRDRRPAFNPGDAGIVCGVVARSQAEACCGERGRHELAAARGLCAGPRSQALGALQQLMPIEARSETLVCG